jgi:hypothetical protein
MNTFFHDRLQYNPAEHPISFPGGTCFATFARYPTNRDPIPLDAVDGLQGMTLVETTKDGVNRFALRRENDGTVLTPMDEPRRVQVSIGGEKKYFNVANLVGSSIIRQDVTGNEYGILWGEHGLYIESAADRAALCDDLKRKCSNLERKDLTLVPRPNSDDIDVRGKGYYVEGGTVYHSKGTPIHVSERGTIKLTGTDGRKKEVGLGWILFGAYPEFYGYVSGLHTEMDHINGKSKDNNAWNFRPMTALQNKAVCHRTGSRSERPSDDSSHETFKRDKGNDVTAEHVEEWIQAGALKRYMNTPYWMHSDGAVLRRTPRGGFVFASLTVNRNKYTYVGRRKVHIMMMKAFGEHVDGKVVMHLDGDRQNNRLTNLCMGTSKENAEGKIPVTIHIRHDDGTVVEEMYESVCEAARIIGIAVPTIGYNRKRQRPDSPLEYSKTRDGITFAAVEAVLENLAKSVIARAKALLADPRFSEEATSKDPVKRARKLARSKLEPTNLRYEGEALASAEKILSRRTSEVLPVSRVDGFTDFEATQGELMSGAPHRTSLLNAEAKSVIARAKALLADPRFS